MIFDFKIILFIVSKTPDITDEIIVMLSKVNLFKLQYIRFHSFQVYVYQIMTFVTYVNRTSDR